jgi:hypothetical protein
MTADTNTHNAQKKDRSIYAQTQTTINNPTYFYAFWGIPVHRHES